MKKDPRRRVLMIVSLSVLFALSRSARSASDSLCCSFSSVSSGLRLTIRQDYTVSGMLPLRICDLSHHIQYDLSISGRGFENRAAGMEMTAEGIPQITGYRAETILMNSILPTSGTFKRGREQQGYLDLLSMAGGLYQFYEENKEYRDLKDRYDLLNSYLQSSGSIDEAEQLRKEAHRAYVYAEQQNTYRKQLLALTSALYAFQILEPVFIDTPPAYRIDQGSSHIVFNAKRKSAGKAFIYSLIRPGRGQYYQGKNIRGLFFSAASVLAGYVALDQNNQYQKKLDDYNISLDEYNYARTVSERRDYLRSASILRADAEDARDNRNLSLYILAGIWGANLIDTVLFECSGTECGYSFNITPGGFELAYRF